MNCEECLSQRAGYYCQDCEELLCEECDNSLHKGGKRKLHMRRPLCRCGFAGENMCCNCSEATCSQCQYHHAGHILDSLSAPSETAVFWDLSSCKPKSTEDIHQTLNDLQIFTGKIGLIRAYGEVPSKWAETLSSKGVLLQKREGLQETHAILLDMSVVAAQGFTQVLVLSASASSVRPHLAQLQSSLPHLRILISPVLFPLDPLPVDGLPEPSEETNDQVYHFFHRKEGQTPAHDALIEFLKTLANRGQLMHEIDWLAQAFSGQEDIRSVYNVIESGRAIGIFHVSEKLFGNTPGGVFVSLKLDYISLESLLWVLRSLKNDEMLPNEKAMHSRMKEAFDFKPTPQQWEELLNGCKEFTPSTVFSLNPLSTDQMRNIPGFSIVKSSDPATGIESNLIYPRGEEWESMDQYIREDDSIRVKETDEWRHLCSFLDSYFAGVKGKIDESKALAGGRYGCAQFLKTCGPPLLSKYSLGRLSYMVQLAINEGVLRYQHNLLVWNTQGNKQIEGQVDMNKLRAAKRLIIETLREQRGGVSLAQLPQILKKKHGFSLDVTSLGYPKLKDLLSSMSEVGVELRGQNNPIAVLWEIKSEEVKRVLGSIIRDNKWGVSVNKAESLLVRKMGRSIVWKDLKCNSIYDFVRKNASADFDVAYNNDSKLFVKRSMTRPGSFEVSTNHSKESSRDNWPFNGPPQKTINVSNLPSDFVSSQQSGAYDFEETPRRWEAGSADLKQMMAFPPLGRKVQSTNTSFYFDSLNDSLPPGL